MRPGKGDLGPSGPFAKGEKSPFLSPPEKLRKLREPLSHILGFSSDSQLGIRGLAKTVEDLRCGGDLALYLGRDPF